MTRSSRPTRDQQPFTGGIGKTFTSPIKRSNPKRPNPIVNPLGHDVKRQRLQEKLRALQASATLHDEPSKIECTAPATPLDPSDLSIDSEIPVDDAH
ncbi:hypothetical protein H0H93_004537, partial [Arthromyces matolae]